MPDPPLRNQHRNKDSDSNPVNSSIIHHIRNFWTLKFWLIIFIRMKKQTWTPTEDKDQRVQEHPSVHQTEGGPLLVAKVTIWCHDSPVNTTGFNHEHLVQERRFIHSETSLQIHTSMFLFHVTSHPFVSCRVNSRLVMSRHILLCHFVSFHVMSNHVKSFHITSYPVTSRQVTLLTMMLRSVRKKVVRKMVMR